MSSAEPRLSFALSFDFDAMSVWIPNSLNPKAVSRGEFCAIAIPRILAMLARQDVRATFFIPGHTALAFPNLVRAIADAGHEIGHHGWVHENTFGLDEAGERAVIEKGFEALDKVAGVRPVGYRSPADYLSPQTMALLHEYGMEYDSSSGASDFTAYYARVGDVITPDRPYVFGEPVDMVELPFSWLLDDFPHFEFFPGWATEQKSPSQVFEIWKGEFDYAYDEIPGGIYSLCTHPQVIGRGPRLRMLEELIESAKRPGVVFEPLVEYQRRWRAANPLEQWVTSGSTLTGKQAIASLS